MKTNIDSEKALTVVQTQPADRLRETPILNGNKFVSIPHVFIKDKGCYFPTLEIAISQGTSPNGVGLWTDQITFNGQTFHKAGNLNAWD